MSVTNTFANVTTATGAQLDQNFNDCLQLNAANKLTNSLNYATSVTLASAASVAIGAAASNNITISGTTTVTSFDTIAEGAIRNVTYSGAVPITYNVTSMQLVGGVSRTNSVGDVSIFRSLGSGNWVEEIYQSVSGSIVGTASQKLPTIGCTQAGGALTFTAAAIPLDFRSTTLTSGAITTINAAPANLVLPSGGTLGAVSTVSARIIVVELNNAGTAELAIVNIAGGNDLSETGVISTTAISAASTANNVFYSTTARTNVAYRVVGAVDAVNTAGAWANPTLVQGAGGQAIQVCNLGQGWQVLTGSRVLGTTYYNTTGKEIKVNVNMTSSVASTMTGSINGTVIQSFYQSVAGNNTFIFLTVPPGNSYSANAAAVATLQAWNEER